MKHTRAAPLLTVSSRRRRIDLRQAHHFAGCQNVPPHRFGEHVISHRVVLRDRSVQREDLQVIMMLGAGGVRGPI